jgi:hypothetical protein
MKMISKFLAFVAILQLFSFATQAQFTFVETTYAVPNIGGGARTNGSTIRTADFNHDGWADIAMVGYRKMMVMLGTGNGAFAPVDIYSITPDPASDNATNLAFGDFNEDGHIDIVVSPGAAYSYSIGAIIFYGTGSGTFNPAAALPSPHTGSDLVQVADLNNDGHDDVLSAFLPNRYLHLGTGTGTFNSSYIPGLPYHTFIFIKDINNDGFLDFASGYGPTRINLGDGTGNFSTAFTFASDPGSNAILEDMDGDNIVDLVGQQQYVIVIFKGNGDGTFQTTPFASLVPTNNLTIHDIKVADINNDGNRDILVTHSRSAGTSRTFILAYLGNGVGGFGPETFLAASQPSSLDDYMQLDVADLNNDGRLDFSIKGQNDEVWVLLNTTVPPPSIASFTPTSGSIGTTVTISGTNFSTTPANNIVYFGATRANVTAATSTQLTVIVPTGATYQPITVQVAGLTAYSAKPFVVTFAGGGNIDACSFAANIDFITGSGPYKISMNDLDGDGRTDLAVTNRTSHTVSIFRNTSTGPGNVTYAAKIDFQTGLNPRGISTGDFDGDGKADLVLTNYGSNTVSVFRNTSTGPGNINFAIKVDFITGTFPDQVSIGDLDQDGKIDLAVANTNSNSVSVFRNVSTGPGDINYDTKVDFTTGTMPYEVSIGDLDGDGKADLVVENSGSNTLSVFRNTSTGPGNINYGAKVDFTTGVLPFGLSIGDLDGDGKTDLAVVNETDNTVSIFRNTSTGPGNIGYAAKTDFTTGSTPYQVSISDIDGDGKVDLAVTNSTSSTLAILRNTSTGPGNISYAVKVDFATGSTNFGLFSGDLDGDGKSDLALINFSSNTVSVFRNAIGEISPPTFTSFTPSSGAIGTTVTITGTNFTTPFSNAVKFNGVTATITASTATSLTVTVPAGATTGLIEVTIGCNTVTSATNFTITVPPTVTSFTPTSGPISTTVTITGTNFSTTPANNIVYFGATRANVTAATSTQLTVTVPAGATYQPITVQVAGLTAYSAKPFVVTFAGGGNIDACSFAPRVDLATPTPAGTEAGGVLGDVDGDGKIDLIVPDRANNLISVYRNTSTAGFIAVGSFAPKVDFSTGSGGGSIGPIKISFGDLDGDGKPDVAVANFNMGTISVFKNTSNPGAIALQPKVDFAIGNLTSYSEIYDIDADGKPEIIVASFVEGIAVLRNTSIVGTINTSSFAPRVTFATATPQSIFGG